MENTNAPKNRNARRGQERLPDAEAWMTVQQAAEYTGYHAQTIRGFIKRRELACIRRGRTGHIRIRRSELDRWARRNTVSASKIAQ